MNKQRTIIISLITIVLTAALLFLFLKDDTAITDRHIEKIIKEKYGWNVEILESAETVNFRWDGDIKLGIIKKEDVKYNGKWTKVRTIDKNPIEFEIEVKKSPGKPLKIVGDNLDRIEKNITDTNVKKLIKMVYGWDVTIIESKEVHNFKFDKTSRLSDVIKKENTDYTGKWLKVKTIEKNPIEFEIEVIKRQGGSIRIVGENLDVVKGK